MLKEKMFVGIVKDDLMVRVLNEKYEEYIQKPNAREMDFTGKPLKGYLYVSPGGFKTDKQLAKWIELGVEYALNSPPKKPVKKKKTAKK